MSWDMVAARLVLELREVLVRHDENAKARLLMDQCVPYVAEGRRDIEQARRDQDEMTEHLYSDAAMEAYYANNVYDKPYEEQYGLADASDALIAIPRFGVLAERLSDHAKVMDLACNDGILAAALVKMKPDITVDGIDLSPTCIARARNRQLPGRFEMGDACSLSSVASSFWEFRNSYTDVVAFELIEHVADPQTLLAAAQSWCQPGGRVWVSTPNGAMEQGNLPKWDRVEPKGHVRAYTPHSFNAELELAGLSLVEMLMTSDNVLIAQTTSS